MPWCAVGYAQPKRRLGAGGVAGRGVVEEGETQLLLEMRRDWISGLMVLAWSLTQVGVRMVEVKKKMKERRRLELGEGGGNNIRFKVNI